MIIISASPRRSRNDWPQEVACKEDPAGKGQILYLEMVAGAGFEPATSGL